MLRKALLGFSALLTIAGGFAWLAGYPLWTPALCGAVLLVSIVFERWRYVKPKSDQAGRWEATGERFIDPASGRATEVFYDPATGERHYVQAPMAD